jgi:hypothetical protein
VDWQGALARAGYEDVLGPSTAYAAFTVFGGGFERVPVSGLSERLDRLDPRRDPYIENMDRFFSSSDSAGDGWQVVFPRPAGSIVAFMLKMSAQLGRYGESWVLADWSAARGGLSLALAVLAATMLVLRLPPVHARIGFALGLLPWMAPVALGGTTELLLFLLCAVTWARLYPQGIEIVEALLVRGEGLPRLPRVALLAPLPTVLALIGLAVGGVPFLSGVFPTLAPALGLLAAGAALRLRLSFTFHRLFTPLRLVRPPVPRWVRRRHLAPVALLAILGPLLAASAGSDLEAPAPVAVDGVEGIGFDDLRRLWHAGQEGDLPNLADYVAHVAYQSSIEYGRAYGFPEGEITTSSFSRSGADPRIVRTESVVLRFDEAWLEGVIGSIDPRSLEGMLLAQGRAVRVGARAIGGVEAGFSWWSGLTAVIFFLIAFLPFDLGRRPVVSSASFERAA